MSEGTLCYGLHENVSLATVMIFDCFGGSGTTTQLQIGQRHGTPVIIKGFPICVSPPACAVCDHTEQHSDDAKYNARNRPMTNTGGTLAIDIICEIVTVGGSVLAFFSM